LHAFGPYLTAESRVLVMGLPRYGKTTLIRDVLTRDAYRVIYHDITGHDYAAPGRLVLTIDELEANESLLDAEFVRIVVVARHPGDPDYLTTEVRRIVRLLAVTGDIVAVFDEAGAHERKTEKVLNNLFARGGHYGIATIISSQKATDISLGARINASDAYCFGQHHPKELEALYNAYGDLFAQAVANLRKRDPPVHWESEHREKWWSVEARAKFLRVKSLASGGTQ